MKHQHESLTLLRDANPVSVKSAAVHSAKATAAFEEIVREPRGPRDVPRQHRGAGRFGRAYTLRARVALGGAVLTAVAVSVIVVTLSGSTVTPAFAQWTPRPALASPEQITNITRRCALGRPALVEARGPYTAAVFVKRTGGSACVLGPGIGFGVASLGGVQASDDRLKPDQIGTAVTVGSDSRGDAYVLIAGRVGSDVRSIVVHRRNNVDVIASIGDGWYLAWWPARQRATAATVTTTHGARTVSLPPLATSGPPPCGGRAGTACAVVSGGGDSNGGGSAGASGPPLIRGPVAKPFNRTLLLNVDNASRVLVCFHPPSNPVAALQPSSPTGPCTSAARLTRLPSSYPVQRNLLEVFPKSVWMVKLPARAAADDGPFLIVAFGTSGQGQMRNEITLN